MGNGVMRSQVSMRLKDLIERNKSSFLMKVSIVGIKFAHHCVMRKCFELDYLQNNKQSRASLGPGGVYASQRLFDNQVKKQF